MKRRAPAILLHIAFWTGIWFLFFYFFSYNSSDRGYVIWFSSLLLPLTMANTYFSVYFLIPRYLYRKEYGRFLLFGFYTLLASAYFIVLIIYGVLIFYKRFDASQIPPMVKNFFFILILVYLVVALVSFVTILNRNFEIEKRNRDLRNRMLSAQLQMKEQELHYLKKQIHPHFLFNTLNTIYGLALKQSVSTPDIILKLSNLLDYILYHVDKPRVPLREEVLHIEEYIDLERIRYRDTLNAEFRHPAVDEGMEIAPMLLIPFVENAFKHGALREGRFHIRIDMEVQDRWLTFAVRNPAHYTGSNGVQAGMGLGNLEKRLEMNYPERYHLEFGYRKDWFAARLNIQDPGNIDEPQES